MRTSRRTDQPDLWQTASTKAVGVLLCVRARITAGSVSRGFVSAVCTTLGSGSRRSSAAILPEPRLASESRSPEGIVSSRLIKVSSATTFTSAGTAGASATRMRSKVKRCRRSGMATCRGALGCSISASLTLRLARARPFLLRRARTSEGMSLR